MPIFNDLYYNAPSSQYVKKPIQDFVNAASSINQTYDKNKADIDAKAIAKSNLSAMNDVHNKQQQNAYDEAFSTLQPFIDNNNYEDAASASSKAALQIATNPLIKHISEEKANYDNWVKTNQEGIKNGTINPNDFKARSYINNILHNKPISIDPVTGETTNKFQGDFIPPDPKIDKQVIDLMEKFQKNPTDLPPDVRQKIEGYINVSENKGRTADNLKDIAMQVVLNNPDNQAYLKYKADNIALMHRLQPDGTLAEYKVADLIDTGVVDVNGNILIKDDKTTTQDEAEEMKAKLFPDGKTLDQEEADRLFKQNFVNKENESLINKAGAFAYQNTDKKFLADEGWKFRNQKELARYTQSLKDQSDAASKFSEYFGHFNHTPGTAYTITNQQGTALFSGGKTSTAMSIQSVPENLKNGLGGKNPITVANMNNIKTWNNELLELKQKLLKEPKNPEIGSTGISRSGTVNKNINKYKKQMLELRKKINDAAIEIEANDKSISFNTPNGKKSFDSYVAAAREASVNYKFVEPESNKEYYTQLKEWSHQQNAIRKLGQQPVSVSNQTGGANTVIDSDGNPIVDVEYTLLGNKDGGIGGNPESGGTDAGLTKKEVEKMVASGTLIEVTPQATNADEEVTKFATYKWAAKAKLPFNPNAAPEYDFNTNNKGIKQQSYIDQANATIVTRKLNERLTPLVYNNGLQNATFKDDEGNDISLGFAIQHLSTITDVGLAEQEIKNLEDIITNKKYTVPK